MQIHSAMLLSDWLMWSLIFFAAFSFFWIKRNPQLSAPWRQICQRKIGMIALVILCFYIMVGLMDCVHLRVTYPNQSTQVASLLDMTLGDIAYQHEKTYSMPFATTLYSQSLVTLPSGAEIRTHPRLKYGGASLKNPAQDRGNDILLRSAIGFFTGLLSFLVLTTLFIKFLSIRKHCSVWQQTQRIFQGKTRFAWREAMITFGVIWIVIWIALILSLNYHILGTDKIGQDVFYQTLKSIRTGLIIGTLTTLLMLPFALIFGTAAGYFGGWVDDIIQYLYTTLSSIPGVLLISATILVLQVYINNHAYLFTTLMQRADARLLALCLILGITSWASLCRLLRGETLKLRELDFVAAAKTLGVKNCKIVLRHIFPNVMHIVIITLVLDFSSLVLAEAVLSYVGVGVDPTTISWGNMINSSRLELAREPIVWWPLLAALIFMFLLVLSANLFADTVRDAFDPRLREME